ncbi:hypothetical protein ACI68E_001232 [Malassezia pachydermatis]|uniref:Urease accessory protein n=1 Tax=Malassezia pachydermatis TaxID=77020 RepID=A0A0M8MS62_9BASI|nr:hypothetical protein Malapachy_1679 [Malassezia pachydermatis]KOS13254.1 hypothetical protein Malapachy_1679 [Malassezia pachydermatis]
MVHGQHAFGRAILRKGVNDGEIGAPKFSHLEATFPLRLLTPQESCRDATINAAAYRKVPFKGVGVLFMVSYGGGLVCGDNIELDVDVGSDTRLLILTQGSTKVYRERRGGDAPAVIKRASGPAPASQQYIRYLVRENSTLILLPAPVTCYARSRYSQVQRIDLRSATTSSLVLLDWFTSGRLAVDGPRESTDFYRIPELWHFYLYQSRNEVRVDGQVIARDRQQLEQDLPEVLQRSDKTELARRCEPYTCFAFVILYGPECKALCEALLREYDTIQQPQPLLRSGGTLGASHVEPPDVLWSASPLFSGAPVPGSDRQTTGKEQAGLILRIAGMRTDTVRAWLYEHLSHVRYLVGDDMYHVALG